jgi:hypothetical protein
MYLILFDINFWFEKSRTGKSVSGSEESRSAVSEGTEPPTRGSDPDSQPRITTVTAVL